MRAFFVFLGLWIFAPFAHAECISGDEAPLIQKLKQDLLAGDYDKFFEITNKTQALSESVVRNTTVQLIQYIGIPETCVTMMNKHHSESFETTLLAFFGREGQHLYAYFALFKMDGKEDLAWVEISTEFDKIHQYLE